MTRYINAEETKSVIKENDWRNPAVPNVVNMIIDRIPTADVEEVRHGKWVDDIFGQGDMICSECEQYPATDEDGNPLSALACWQPEYCPNCGAKMDGKEDKTQ